MSLIPLTDPKEIKEAFGIFSSQLQKGGQRFERTIGWQGGHEDVPISWHENQGIWLFCVPTKTRYWCGFGTSDPMKHKNLATDCQMTPSRKGIDRRFAGAFAHDGAGRIYATHSGKLGGGHKGVGKSAYVDFYRGDNWETLVWPDGQESKVIVIGRIDSPRLLYQIAHFTREAERFKSKATDVGSGIGKKKKTACFSPEFAGQREGYRIKGTIEAQCDHGLVISALADKLAEHGIKCGNDRFHDLFVMDRKGGMAILFEAKTDLTTASIYQAVGQLLINGTAEGTHPKLVMVVPGNPNSRTKNILTKLGIIVLRYEWRKSTPVFAKVPKTFAQFGIRK